MLTKRIIEDRIQHNALRIQGFGISKIGLFGSYARQEQQEGSDIDLLVEFGRPISLLDFVHVKLELEELLGKTVDLVEYQSIKPRLQQRILSEEIRIYG